MRVAFIFVRIFYTSKSIYCSFSVVNVDPKMYYFNQTACVNVFLMVDHKFGWYYRILICPEFKTKINKTYCSESGNL